MLLARGNRQRHLGSRAAPGKKPGESHGEGKRGLHSPKTPRSERGKSRGTQLRAPAHQATAWKALKAECKKRRGRRKRAASPGTGDALETPGQRNVWVFFAAGVCGLSLREPHQPQPPSIPSLTDAATCRVDLFYRLLLARRKPSAMAQGRWHSGHRAGYGDGGGKAGPAPKAEEECEKPGLVFHPPDIPGEAHQR